MDKSTKPKVVKRFVTDRDYAILKFLWKWKCLSTRAISKRFFPKANPFTTYVRLTQLQGAGYIEPVEVEGKSYAVWTLTKKGFQKIRPKMVELALDGYKSENYHHDYLATAFHLGEWLIAQPSGTQTFSEQQLRRIPEDLWPEWIPRSSTHRPDGYSLVSRDGINVTCAFEAELSPKAKSRYEKTVAFYDSQKNIHLVLWLIKSEGLYRTMKDAFEKYYVRDWQKHHFVLLSDFQKKGWMAPVIAGQYRGETISRILGYITPTKPLLYPYESCVLEMLDSQKRPAPSTASLVRQLPK
jgi:hypothetical protein